MNNNKESSVEWYDNEIGKLFNEFIVDKITIYKFRTEQLKLKQQAKAIHKEETLKLYYAYEDYVLREEGIIKTFGQFYNETFGG